MAQNRIVRKSSTTFKKQAQIRCSFKNLLLIHTSFTKTKKYQLPPYFNASTCVHQKEQAANSALNQSPVRLCTWFQSQIWSYQKHDTSPLIVFNWKITGMSHSSAYWCLSPHSLHRFQTLRHLAPCWNLCSVLYLKISIQDVKI